jgi:hypothetical protein
MIFCPDLDNSIQKKKNLVDLDYTAPLSCLSVQDKVIENLIGLVVDIQPRIHKNYRQA